MKRNKFITYFLLLLILAFGLFLRTYNLGNRYTFEWDQNDDAVKVMRILHGSLTLIGPRVAGPDSFFVAPWHYYFLVPFYAALQGDPIAGAWAVIFIGMTTVMTYYWVGEKLWGKPSGLVAAWAGAAAYSITSWNVMYTPLLSIITFYLGYKYFEKQKYLWVLLGLSIFAGTTHLVPMTLVIMVIAAYLLVKEKPPVKNFIYAFLIGLVCISPLILFDLRHNFLIFYKIIQFVTAQGVGHIGFVNLLAWRAYYRGLSIMVGLKIGSVLYIIERIVWTGVVIAAVILTKEKARKIWISFWFIFPAVILLFYWKNIPEYYFGVAFALLPLMLAIVAKKYRIVAYLLLTFVSLVQLRHVITQESHINLNDKKEIVTFMTDFAKNRHFNFSYDVPFGEEVGYPYLFAWKGHEPENIPEANLFTLSRDPLTIEKVIYFKKGNNIVQKGVTKQ